MENLIQKIKDSKNMLDDPTTAGTLTTFCFYAIPTNSDWTLSGVWVQKLVQSGLLDIFELIWEKFWEEDYVEQLVKDKQSALMEYLIFFNSASTLQSCTDQHPGFCGTVWERGTVKRMIELLQTNPKYQVGSLAGSLGGMEASIRLELLTTVLGTIHNVLRHTPDNHQQFRAMKGMDTILPFLSLPNKGKEELVRMTKAGAAMIIAKTVTEQNTEALEKCGKFLDYFLKVICKNAIKSKHRSHEGFAIDETLSAVNSMASIDSIKEKLANDKETLEIFWAVLKKPMRAKELPKIAETFWIMSFNKNAREKIVQTLPGLKEEMGKLETHAEEDVQKAAQGVVWNLAGKRPQTAGKKTVRKEGPVGHIMISYDWGHQETAKILNQYLKDAGFRTWFDLEQMSGSTLEAMAEAVENASAIVLCYSEQYRKSPNCQKEAEYADQLNKAIVPVKTQDGYNPDGWLGIILGRKLYFECMSPEQVGEAWERIASELKKNGSAPSLSGPIVIPMETKKTIRSNSFRARKVADSPSNMETVKAMDQEQIQSWLAEKSLGHLADNFRQVNGQMVAQMVNLYKKSPQLFNALLEKIDVTGMEDTLLLTIAFDDF